MCRILVVEDDQVWAQLVQERLEAMGHEVLATCDGLAAFEAIDSKQLDLVVLDVQMPINGRAILWYSNRYRPDLPVVIHTGFATLRNDPDFEGAAEFAVKSPGLEELEQAVTRATEGI